MSYEIGKDGRPGRNFKTGRFLPGHIPHNNGRPWTEWMPEKERERVLEIGKKNLRVNPAVRGWNKRAVVAINEKGEHKYCESATKAAEIMHLERRNITACCQGRREKCGGLYWFYYDSNDWPAFAKKKKEAAQAVKFNQ